MRKLLLLLAIGLLLAFATQPSPALAQKGKNSGCASIPSGQLQASTGETLMPGYDVWGYNYQAHMFNGAYCDFQRSASFAEVCRDVWGYGDVELIMKWNDAWLSNKSCDGDALLDRRYPDPGYIGSGAWITNHMEGSYEGSDGACHFTYFVKIVAAPADATEVGGVWYAVDGTEIGPDIWGAFAVVQEVANDACAQQHGLQYLSPYSAGFGTYGPR